MGRKPRAPRPPRHPRYPEHDPAETALWLPGRTLWQYPQARPYYPPIPMRYVLVGRGWWFSSRDQRATEGLVWATECAICGDPFECWSALDFRWLQRACPSHRPWRHYCDRLAEHARVLAESRGKVVILEL